MAGVPHRSLGRKVLESMLRDIGTLNPDNLPEDAVEEFRGKDPEISLWTDGDDGEREQDVFLSLIFSGKSIRSVTLALLWQDDPRIDGDLGKRIIQSEGETPYVPGRDLHYHVSEPAADDAPRLLRAAINRRKLPTLTQDKVWDLVEDLYLADRIPEQGLDPQKQREIEKAMKKRCVTAAELQAEVKPIVFDVRHDAAGTRKIPGAAVVVEAELSKQIQLAHIAREDVFTLYCADGTESRRMARELRAGPWKKVRVLTGGLQAWLAQGV